MDKKGRRLNKTEKATIERDQLIAKLSEKYVEGESNIDSAQLDADENLKVNLSFPDSIEEKEKSLGRNLPLILREVWLERELAKIESAKKKIPSHKVQDPAAKIVKYKQKFVERIKKVNLQIISDLKELVPYFNNLFRKENKKQYYDIFDGLKYELVNHWHVYPDYNEKRITESDQKYIWGLLKNAFYLSFIKFDLSEIESLSVCPADIIELVEINKFSLEDFTDVIKRAFQETADDQNLILNNFFIMQKNIYQWADKYHLQKDWLVDYAYYFIYQMSNNPDLETKDVEVGIIDHNYAETLYYPFEFRAKGWWAEGETPDQCKKRISKEFEEQLELYIKSASDDLELDQLPKLTKPPNFNNVEWLANMIVKGWDAENILEKFFPQITADKTKNESSFLTFENKLKLIKSEVRKLKEFDLPMPENL